MISNLIAYWIIALPLGCLLGLYFKMYLIGFWSALIIAAIILCDNGTGFKKNSNLWKDKMPHFC